MQFETELGALRNEHVLAHQLVDFQLFSAIGEDVEDHFVCRNFVGFKLGDKLQKLKTRYLLRRQLVRHKIREEQGRQGLGGSSTLPKLKAFLEGVECGHHPVLFSCPKPVEWVNFQLSLRLVFVPLKALLSKNLLGQI